MNLEMRVKKIVLKKLCHSMELKSKGDNQSVIK